MVSILYGGITNHFIGSNLNYCNSLNKIGTIHNEYAIVLTGSKNKQIGFIKGKDSVCSNIFGIISSFRIDQNIRIIAGGYNTNTRDFEKRNIRPVSIKGYTPLIGMDYELPIYKSTNFEIVFHNLLSLGITTHSVGVNF